MRKALLPRIICLAVAAGGALPGCGGPTPSREPLGWGKLPEGARILEPPATPRRTASRRADVRKPATPSGSSDAKPVVNDDRPDGGAPARASSTSSAGGTSGSTAADAFAGEYRGEDTAVYRLAGMPDRTEHDPNARTAARVVSADSVDFVIIDSSNGKELCTLASKLEQGVATIRPGQSCFEQRAANVSVTAKVTSGTAALRGDRLTLKMELDVEMHTGNADLAGTLEYQFEGTRK